MKNNPIPADESRWGRFSALEQRNEIVLRGILEDAAQNQTRSPIDQKIGGFYASCMNEPAIEQLGAKPLYPELERIRQIKDAAGLLDEIAGLQQRQINVFFAFAPMPDLKDAKMTIAGLDQGGLGLPEKDYYFRTDAKSVEIRQKYLATIAKMFTLIGVPAPQAAKKAATVMAIETELAKGSLDVTSRRDPQKLFHEMPKSELAQLSPQFHFDVFFNEVKSPSFTTINVAVPEFVKTFNALLSARPMADLQDYLVWQYVHASAPLLSKAFVDENFDFYGRTLMGTKEIGRAGGAVSRPRTTNSARRSDASTSKRHLVSKARNERCRWFMRSRQRWRKTSDPYPG